MRPVFLLAADVRLVYFHGALHHGQIQLRHRIANPMRHKPRALVGHAKHSMELMGAHSLFGCTEKMESHQPLVKRDMAVLEDRAHSDGELLAARAALPNAFAVGDFAGPLWLASDRRKLGGLAHKSAVRATRFAIRPALRLKEVPRAIFVVVGFGYLCEVHGVLQTSKLSQNAFGLSSI